MKDIRQVYDTQVVLINIDQDSINQPYCRKDILYYILAQSFCEWDNKITEESDTSESQDDDNGNDKWDFNELLNTSHAIDGNLLQTCISLLC